MEIPILADHSGRRSIFVFGDGTKLNPREFGRLSLKWSLQYGEQLIEELFPPGKPGWMLMYGANIWENPLPAHLYLTLLHLSSFIFYTEVVLSADESVAFEVRSGIREAVKGLQHLQLSMSVTKPHEHFMDVVDMFFRAIVHDMRDHKPDDYSSLRPPHKATEILYLLLKSAYKYENSEVPFLGFMVDDLQPYAIKTQHVIDGVPQMMVTVLQDQVKVRLDVDLLPPPREPSTEEMAAKKTALLLKQFRDLTLRLTHNRITMQEGENIVSLEKLQQLSDYEVASLPENIIVVMAGLYRKYVGEGGTHESSLQAVNATRVHPVQWKDIAKYQTIEEYIVERLKVELAANPTLKYFTHEFVSNAIQETNLVFHEVLGYQN